MGKQLPIILRTPGLRLVEIGEDEDGAYLKFWCETELDEDHVVREVVMYMHADQPIKWTYVYAIYDKETQTIATHRGRTGNPKRDRVIDVRGAG